MTVWYLFTLTWPIWLAVAAVAAVVLTKDWRASAARHRVVLRGVCDCCGGQVGEQWKHSEEFWVSGYCITCLWGPLPGTDNTNRRIR